MESFRRRWKEEKKPRGIKMKKIHVSMILTLSVFMTSHAHASEVKAPMEGVYLGANIGYSKYKIEGFAETFPPDYMARKRTDLDIKLPRLRLSLPISILHSRN